jgi:hypothetical protein
MYQPGLPGWIFKELPFIERAAKLRLSAHKSSG